MRPLLALAGLLVALPVVAAYQNGPMPGVTGGFGEPTCTMCHQGPPPGPKDGRLSLEAPREFRPGQTYQLRVTLTRRNLAVGGFEVAARFQTRPAAGAQAGTLRSLDPRTQVVTGAKGVQFAQHTQAGSKAVPPGKMTWVVEWRAPEQAPGNVLFHVAANAASGDASPLGDLIHTLEVVSRPAPAARAGSPAPVSAH
ncbi:MAG TPA: hypothetical protein PKK95_02465 [Vicinamibacterales bacterium]|nr:hypothetical protein [Vicinamibacterales bacterium]